MIDLFKPIKKTKSVKQYTVECINKERGIICSLSYNPVHKCYITCLVLGNRAVRTSFANPLLAQKQISKYKEQYK